VDLLAYFLGTAEVLEFDHGLTALMFVAISLNIAKRMTEEASLRKLFANWLARIAEGLAKNDPNKMMRSCSCWITEIFRAQANLTRTKAALLSKRGAYEEVKLS
jgi:hypothetical protein